MFKNLWANKIIKNSSYLITGQVLNKLFFLILIILISKTLGVKGLGVYGFIFAFIGFIFPFSNIASKIFIRDLIINKEHIHKFWGNYLVLKFFNSLIVYIVVIIITIVFPIPEELKLLIYLTGLTLFFGIFSHTARCIFISYKKIKSLVLANIASELLIVILSIFFLLLGKGILWVIISFVIGEAVNAMILNFILVKQFLKPDLRMDVKLCIKWVKKGFYFIMQRQLTEGLFRMDILIISLMGGLYATGLYEAPYKIANSILGLVPLLFGMIIYPHYISVNQASFKRLKVNYTKYKRYIAIVSLIVCLFLFIFSKQIILLIYDKEFLRSILIFKIFVISIFFWGLTINNRTLLNAIKKERVNFYLSLFIFLLNILLNIVLIKPYGIVGVALSTAVCYITYFTLTEYYIKRNL